MGYFGMIAAEDDPEIFAALFRTAEECCNHLEHILSDSPGSRATLERLRNGVITSARTSWSEAWTAEARDALIPRGADRQV